MGPLGLTEVFFILVIALLLFGPRRLPELGRMVGRGLAEFRRASADLRSTIEDEIRSLENDSKSAPPGQTPSLAPPGTGPKNPGPENSP